MKINKDKLRVYNLVHTHETIDKLIEQYYEEDEESDYIMVMRDVFLSEHIYDVKLYVLYLEYSSLRKVADESGSSYAYVNTVVKRINKKIMKGYDNISK